MSTGTYTQSNSPTATYGTSSAANAALQQAINASGGISAPIAADSKYGPQTQAAYNNLIGQGYTYNNGAFTKPTTTTTTNTPPATTSTTATAGSVMGTGKFATPGYDSSYDTGLNNAIDTYGNTANTPIDENAIRTNTLGKFQAEIDATNALYAQKLAEAKVQGNSRLGSSAAIQGRRGLLGSDFGAALTDNQTTANTGVENAIEQDRLARISNIMTGANAAADAEIAAKKAAKESGTEKYIQYLKERATTKAANALTAANALVSQGFKPSDLSSTELDALAKTYGITTDAIKAAFPDAQTAATAKNASSRYKSIADGTQLYDTQTGKVIAENVKDPSATAAALANASPALLDAITNGTIDPNRLNSRTIGLYNDIASANVNAVSGHATAAAKSKAVEDLTRYKTTVARVVNTVDRNVPLLANLADIVNTSNTPAIDNFINGVQTYTGNDVNLCKYINTLATLRSEYAQMIARGNAVTESDKAEAAKAIPSGKSGDFYRGLAAQLDLEGKNIVDTVDESLGKVFSAPKSTTVDNSGFGWNG